MQTQPKSKKAKHDDGSLYLGKKCKRVPWHSWIEWNFVKNSLFSSDPNLRLKAAKRVCAHLKVLLVHYNLKVLAWESRCKVPVTVEASGSLVDVDLQSS